MPNVAVRGQELAVRHDGTGPIPIVCVHGFQNDASAWDPFVERLDPDRYRVTRFDLAGCGASSAPASWERCTIAEYAADLLALFDQLGWSPPIATITWAGILRRPGRPRPLELVAPVSTSGSTSCHPSASTARHRRATSRSPGRAAFRHPRAGTTRRPLAVIARATPEHTEGAARSCLFTIAPELAALDARSARGRRQARPQPPDPGIRRCGLQVYFDVGHVPFQETPERFAEDVARFLNGLE
jgi:sigma-B regulation protein RsbQ